MKRGDAVAVSDPAFSGTVRGWLWDVFLDDDHPEDPGCVTYSVLPWEEAGTENVWEGRACELISSPPPPYPAPLLALERAAGRLGRTLVIERALVASPEAHAALQAVANDAVRDALVRPAPSFDSAPWPPVARWCWTCGASPEWSPEWPGSRSSGCDAMTGDEDDDAYLIAYCEASGASADDANGWPSDPVPVCPGWRPKTPGILVAVDGLDGAGKTTLVALLASWLRGLGVPVLATKEPSDGVHGRRIRELAARGERLPPAEELALFALDRADHVEREIGPALRRGDVVITDRYTDSTLVYQGLRGLPREEIERVAEAPFPAADVTLILTIPVPLALERIRERRRLLNPCPECDGSGTAFHSNSPPDGIACDACGARPDPFEDAERMGAVLDGFLRADGYHLGGHSDHTASWAKFHLSQRIRHLLLCRPGHDLPAWARPIGSAPIWLWRDPDLTARV